MLLENKNAVIYGAGGAVGGAVARAFAREGARVFLTGRRLPAVNAVAEEISGAGGMVEADEDDALDEQGVEKHIGAVVKKAGTIDVSFNAIGIPAAEVARQGMQGIPFTELSLEAFSLPFTTYPRAHFVTAKAVARRMVEQRSGVILMHTPEPGRLGVPLLGGMGPAWAAMESLCRNLSAEVASYGVRVVCLRSTGLPETATIDVVFGIHAKAGYHAEAVPRVAGKQEPHAALDHACATDGRSGLDGLRSGWRNDRNRRQPDRRRSSRLGNIGASFDERGTGAGADGFATNERYSAQWRQRMNTIAFVRYKFISRLREELNRCTCWRN